MAPPVRRIGSDDRSSEPEGFSDDHGKISLEGPRSRPRAVSRQSKATYLAANGDMPEMAKPTVAACVKAQTASAERLGI